MNRKTRVIILFTLGLLWTVTHFFILAFGVIKDAQEKTIIDSNKKIKIIKSKDNLYKDSIRLKKLL